MLAPNVELIGTPSNISEGVAISLETKLHLIKREFTLEPKGVVVELNDKLVVVDGPKTTLGAYPIIGAIDPDAARLNVGVEEVVGNPFVDVADQYPDVGWV